MFVGKRAVESSKDGVAAVRPSVQGVEGTTAGPPAAGRHGNLIQLQAGGMDTSSVVTVNSVTDSIQQSLQVEWSQNQ